MSWSVPWSRAAAGANRKWRISTAGDAAHPRSFPPPSRTTAPSGASPRTRLQHKNSKNQINISLFGEISNIIRQSTKEGMRPPPEIPRSRGATDRPHWPAYCVCVLRSSRSMGTSAPDTNSCSSRHENIRSHSAFTTDVRPRLNALHWDLICLMIGENCHVLNKSCTDWRASARYCNHVILSSSI